MPTDIVIKDFREMKDPGIAAFCEEIRNRGFSVEFLVSAPKPELKKLEPREYEHGISIYITAYHTKDCIDETLKSVYAQTWFKENDNWEVVLICDGDRELYDYLKPNVGKLKNFRLLCTKANVGTYVASNTAARQCKYDWIMRFDSDDIMASHCIEKIVEATAWGDAVYFRTERWGRMVTALGHVCIGHNLFDELGGFEPWPCSADTNLRLRIIPFYRVVYAETCLMTYGQRENSLTNAPETGFDSPVRNHFRELNKHVRPLTKEDSCIGYTDTVFEEYKGE